MTLQLPCFALFLLLAGCVSTPATPNEPDAQTSAGPISMPDIVARKQASASSSELAGVADLLGSWSVALEFVTPGEERAHVVARGSAEITPDLGGRFLCWATRLEADGETIESRGRLGFDRRLEVFELLWVSELSSAQRLARGRGDARRGGIQLDWGEIDPETEAILRSRTVLKIEDRERFSLEQWGLDPDTSEWVPVSRTKYRRASN